MEDCFTRSDWSLFSVTSYRVIKDGSMWYLVKWRELGYDQATWELEGEDIPDLQNQIDNYYDLRYGLQDSHD